MELPAANPNSVGLLRKRERTAMAGGLCATPCYRHCHSEYILDAPQGYLRQQLLQASVVLWVQAPNCTFALDGMLRKEGYAGTVMYSPAALL